MSAIDRSPFHTPEHPDADFPESWEGGHALIIEYGDCEFISHCQCGKWLDTSNPARFNADHVTGRWEQHCVGRKSL